jgi:hypothetical protein
VGRAMESANSTVGKEGTISHSSNDPSECDVLANLPLHSGQQPAGTTQVGDVGD